MGEDYGVCAVDCYYRQRRERTLCSGEKHREGRGTTVMSVGKKEMMVVQQVLDGEDLAKEENDKLKTIWVVELRTWILKMHGCGKGGCVACLQAGLVSGGLRIVHGEV